MGVEIENTGRSPARSVRAISTSALRPADWTVVDDTTVSGEEGLGVIGPGQVRTLNFETSFPLTQELINDFAARRKRLFFFSRVTFSDQFSDDRALRFCFYVELPKVDGLVSGLPHCSGYDSVK